MAVPITEQTKDIPDSISLKYLVDHIVKNLNKTYVILILAISLYGIYTIALTPNLFSGGDNAHYLVLADALQSGQGYKTISQISAPFATERPPGFPMMLAPIIYGKNLDILAIKRITAIWGPMAILAVYYYFKQKTNASYALGIAFLFAIMPIVFMYTRRIYASMPFTTITFLAFIFIHTYAQKKHWLNGHLILSSLLITIAFYLRTIGFVLLISAVLWLLIRKQFAKAISLTVLCTPLMAFWFYWTSQVQQTVRSGYLSQLFQTGGVLPQIQLGISNLVGNMRLIAENIFYLSSKVPQQLHLTTPIFAFISYLAIIIVLIFIIVGFLNSKIISLPNIYLFLYVSILFIWPHVINRFIIPILPFMIHYYIQGITRLSRWLYQRFNISKKLAYLLFIGLIFEIVLSGLVHIPARLYQEQQFHNYNAEIAAFYDVAGWAGQNLSQDAVVSTQDNNFFYIYSLRRQTVPVEVDGILPIETNYFIAPSQDISSTAKTLYCAAISDVCIFEFTE
ncbi:MAG: glycosyltransferase family 39 protein [Chloroflexi bacterium]|nr:glycosyltransferase family 39 protein [Chloroflexota bacterium]